MVSPWATRMLTIVRLTDWKLQAMRWALHRFTHEKLGGAIALTDWASFVALSEGWIEMATGRPFRVIVD